jgi:cell division protease FtsH
LPSLPWGGQEREYSEQTAREIDLEVRKILDDATEEVRNILQVRRGGLEAVAQRLVEREVIEGSELRRLLEEYNPGPKLVPGSLPVAAPVEPSLGENRSEGGLSAGAGPT